MNEVTATKVCADERCNTPVENTYYCPVHTSPDKEYEVHRRVKTSAAKKAKNRQGAKLCKDCGARVDGFGFGQKLRCYSCDKKHKETNKQERALQAEIELIKEGGKPVTKFALTDLGNAERFQWRNEGKFAWTSATNWLAYEGGKWVEDKTGASRRATHTTVRLIEKEIELYDNEEMRDACISWGKASESSAKIESALRQASALLGKDYAAFDQKPTLLNMSNGTYDLPTGDFRKHDPADLLTKQIPLNYDPNAQCPKFEKFVSDLMGGDVEMIAYLQRCCGYTLSADVSEQGFFVPFGPGGCGKSTFLGILSGVMGDYAKPADPEMFMVKRGDSGQPFDLAGLEGTRLLTAIETERGKKMATGKTKNMIGGPVEKIRACYKHKQWFEFQPQWKVWMATNERPDINDDAMFDRLHPIPFKVRFRGTEQEDEHLAENLLAEEGSGILNWMLKGYRAWREQGLNMPEEVKKANCDWRERDDFIQHFLDERTGQAENMQEYASVENMYAAYTLWAQNSHEGRSLKRNQFNEEMERKGYKRQPYKIGGKSVKAWGGLKLVSSYSGSQMAAAISDQTEL